MTKVTWAPVYFEPLPGSGERITVAVCVLGEGHDPQCSPSLDPTVLTKVFPEDQRFVRDVVAMVQESLYAHTCETHSFNGWEPPIEGFELGLPQSGESRDIEEVLSAALRLTSFLHRPEAHQKRCQELTRVKWASSVRSHLVERDDRLRPLVNARVRLSKVNVPCVFSFLSDNYAANLVSFVGRLQESMREARAKAWSLDQLDQAPSILFRPEYRELLAGMPNEGNQHESSKLQDCIDELRQEAGRRNIQVLQFDQPEEAAEHILDRHYSTA